MKLKSFGCSFLFGTDLSDLDEYMVNNWPVEQFSRLTWPALLAQQLNFEYECCARPGSGNLQIAERVLNECAKSSDSFFVIDWTWIDRFDYIKSQDPWQPWGTLRPGGECSISKLYFKNLHTEYKDKLSTLLCVKTTIDILLQKKIKFIMTYEDNLLFDQRWHVSPAILDLQNYCFPYMITFEGLGFLDWSRSKGFEISPTLHPLEQAHVCAKDLIFNLFFDKQKTNDPIQQVPF